MKRALRQCCAAALLRSGLSAALASGCGQNYTQLALPAATDAGLPMAESHAPSHDTADAGAQRDAADGGETLSARTFATPPRVGGENAAGCLAATPLRPQASSPSVLLVAGSTQGLGTAVPDNAAGCGYADPEAAVWYRLDLSDLHATSSIQVLLDAGFDAVLQLRRGACGDTRRLDCDRASAVGRPTSVLTAVLDPGVYWLLVEGVGAQSTGDFQLELQLDAGGTACSEPPEAYRCEQPQRLDPDHQESVFLNVACLPSVDGRSSGYFELDLRAEPAPVATTVWFWRFDHVGSAVLVLYGPLADTLDCSDVGDVVASYGVGNRDAADSKLEAVLPPGRYLIAIKTNDGDEEQEPANRRGALRVQLQRDACQTPATGNGCAAAIPISPSLSPQIFEGSTSCNQNSVTLACQFAGGTPDQFYSLDLRAASGSTQVRASLLEDGLGFDAVLYLLSRNASGDCGAGLYCYDAIAALDGLPRFDLTLPPGEYLIGVDGNDAGQAGPYRLLVEMAPGTTSPCVDQAIDNCVYQNGLQYCCSSLREECRQLLTECGLEPATLACICDADPRCCAAEAESAAPEGACRELRARCGLLCPDFVPSAASCVAEPEAP